jgi:integrase
VFLGRSPDTAIAEDIRRFPIHQSELGMQAPAMNSTAAALRLFFTHTLDRPDLSRTLIRLRYPRKLQSVLSAEEVARLLAATKSLKDRAALAVAYGAGLRVAEVAALKVGDIDSARMLIRVERGKGGRYRHAMLSPDLLTLPRAWWREGRRQGVMLAGGWLFPGQDPSKPITTRQLGRVVEEAAQTADLSVRPRSMRVLKSVSIGGLRHLNSLDSIAATDSRGAACGLQRTAPGTTRTNFATRVT